MIEPSSVLHRDEDDVTEVVVIGAGIIGLANALQFAKRGMQVTLVDNVRDQRSSYKVGESFLVFTSTFLRTIGGLDDFISNESFLKLGVWFTVGAEHRPDFAGATEWAVNADPHPPHYLYDAATDPLWFRCMFLDMQIVRPDAEERMRDLVRAHHRITFIDDARVTDVALGEADAPHVIQWGNRENRGTVRTRWVVDCSGRQRLLARKQGHAAEGRELTDGFVTTAVWGQFEGVTDDSFDERWSHLMRSETSTRRDLYTVHLWGVGYWIWVIRLSKNRISVGATFDQRNPPEGSTPREQFWNLIRRYPVLDGVISESTQLEFRTFRNVQHWTDTFVSDRRYAMVGDAASIIDAYYSQGMALALVTSWHVTNVVQRDLHEGMLDTAYIDRINDATRQDWHMMRTMVREKYTDAIEDPRFFLLSHILDMIVFWSMGSTRSKLAHWLVDTGGDPARETSQLRSTRARLEERLFYSRSVYWGGLSPSTVRRIQEHLHCKLAERARWRLAHGESGPGITSVLSVTAPLPQIWRMLRAGRSGHVDISGRDLVQPAGQRPPGTATWYDRLPLSVNTRLKWVLLLRPIGLLVLFTTGYAWDVAHTSLRRARRLPRLARGVERPGATPHAAEPAGPAPAAATARQTPRPQDAERRPV
jgi:2-polyprenyl-6-methoxyphenol hydroxylase-like FAD-dependent oxidoreductase